MKLVDVHCHLERGFKEEIGEVVNRAREVGVAAIITSSLSLEEAKISEKLIQIYKGYIYRTVGLDYTLLDFDMVEEVARYIEKNRNSIIGIGEVGLDYYVFKSHEKRRMQAKIFGFWVDYAKSVDYPIIVHSRSAGKYALGLLFEHQAERVIMHAFDGKAGYARKGAERGYFFSVPPSIARSPQKQRMVKHLPLESLLLESDAPVLAPNRGEKNEPKNITVSLQWISKIKGVPEEKVADIIYSNTEYVYGLRFS